MIAHTWGQLLTPLAQQVAALPGGRTLRDGFRTAQTWQNRQNFKQLKDLLALPALEQLAWRHPRLAYKYLAPCLATGLLRPARLAILLHHYGSQLVRARADFFSLVLQKQEIWGEQCGGHRFSMALAYPFENDFEGELSVVFCVDATPVYTVTFTLAPGWAVGATARPGAVLVSRVQGTKNFELIKLATRSLHDIAPAALLVQAVQGIAQACGARQVVGVGTHEQLSYAKAIHSFDYDGFWLQMGAAPTANGLYVLPAPSLENPLAAAKANHRARSLRKRQFKQQLRDAVRQHVEQHLLAGG